MSGIASQERWQAVKAQIRALCIDAARHRETITYSDVIHALGPDSGLSPRSPIFHRLLGQMCHEEEEAGRGLLCALVVAKMTGIPGNAFFPTLFAARGCDDLQACWERERDTLFDYWSSHPDEA
jgi:hypothetical protein